MKHIFTLALLWLAALASWPANAQDATYVGVLGVSDTPIEGSHVMDFTVRAKDQSEMDKIISAWFMGHIQPLPGDHLEMVVTKSGCNTIKDKLAVAAGLNTECHWAIDFKVVPQ